MSNHHPESPILHTIMLAFYTPGRKESGGFYTHRMNNFVGSYTSQKTNNVIDIITNKPVPILFLKDNVRTFSHVEIVLKNEVPNEANNTDT